MQKAGAGSAGYLGAGSSYVFVTFIGAAGSIFANCRAASQSRCVPSALAGLIIGPLVTDVYNMN